MDEKQCKFLDDRLHAAAEVQPEIRILQGMLLKIGGLHLVAPPHPDYGIPFMIQSGFLMSGPILLQIMEGGKCHKNVSELWLSKQSDLIGIGTGYALSADGLWRRHSWGVLLEGLLETTEMREKYFGLVLRGNGADNYANFELQ